VLFASSYYPQTRRRIPEYIYWKFRSSQVDHCDSFILALKNGKVVGQLGLIPVVLKIGENTFEAQWFCDLMLDTKFFFINSLCLFPTSPGPI